MSEPVTVLDLYKEITALRAEMETWKRHAKQAIWSDSEECKLLTSEVERLRAALTPSAETKAAYWGEFHFTEHYLDEDGNDADRKITVPWDTVKQIMAAILARAALQQETNDAGRIV